MWYRLTFLSGGGVTLREIQRHHTKRFKGNPRFTAHLFDWAGEKALLKAKGKIKHNTADLLSLEIYLFIERSVIVDCFGS